MNRSPKCRMSWKVVKKKETEYTPQTDSSRQQCGALFVVLVSKLRNRENLRSKYGQFSVPNGSMIRSYVAAAKLTLFEL